MDNHGPLAVYIHWPYCARICPYCDFNVYKQRSDPDLAKAIAADLSYWRSLSGPRQLSSVHFGGGTPSLMTQDEIGNLLNHIDDLWGLEAGTEIALEANPTDHAAFEGMAQAGINRLSLGVQSFDDRALKFMGRDHDGATARQAAEAAAQIFGSVSLDLIFGWLGQTAAQLDQDLTTALKTDIHHISTYQLTIEENTAFARAEQRGQSKAAPDDDSADFYMQIINRLGPAGFEHYEVSNFARPGHQSQHNLAYWRGHDYVGVGPGAHGRIETDGVRFATISHLRPQVYSDAVQDKGHGIDVRDPLSPQDRAEEYVIMGLRISEGLSMARWAELSGETLPDREIKDLIEMGFLSQDLDRLRVTVKGRPVLNHLTDRLLTAQS